MGPLPKTLTAVGSVLAMVSSVTPAHATTPPPGVVVENCFGSAYGVPLRVKLRFEMRSVNDPDTVRVMRVRVTHRHGTGHFHNRKVRSVAATLIFESQGSDPRLGTAVFAERRGDAPVYRKVLNEALSSATAIVTFHLSDGHRAAISCMHRFPEG